MTERRYKLVIVAPTCFYYQVSLFQKLAQHPRFNLVVYFCSDEALDAEDAMKMYKVDASWGYDTDLLEGYEYEFLKNYSPDPSYLKWPHGLMNIGIVNEIRKNRPDAVILMSWMNFTWWAAIIASKLCNVPFFYLTDANIEGEMNGARWKSWVKRVLLGKIIFNWASGFLCAGIANRKLYEFYDVPDRKLIPFAYSWGYEPLLEASAGLKARKKNLREELGIPKDKLVILYSGRLSSEKNPFLLLDAYRSVRSTDKALVFVGDGDLRDDMERYSTENGLENVFFCGFQGRTDIPKYFASADVLVLPSQRETWGMVINEALCLGLPVIASDQVGAVHDLVWHEENGYVFRSGDVNELSGYLNEVLDLPEDQRMAMGNRSLEIITDWMNRDLCDSLAGFFDSLSTPSNG